MLRNILPIVRRASLPQRRDEVRLQRTRLLPIS
jgi:hypothetical protein